MQNRLVQTVKNRFERDYLSCTMLKVKNQITIVDLKFFFCWSSLTFAIAAENVLTTLENRIENNFCLPHENDKIVLLRKSSRLAMCQDVAVKILKIFKMWKFYENLTL